MKLPQYRLLKISSSRKGTSIKAEWVDFVTCGECKRANHELSGVRCGLSDVLMGEDGFCSIGEKSE